MATVLITGANRGIGLEFSRRYAEEGHRVIATCRNPGDAADLRDIEGIEVHRLDVDDLASAYALRRALGDLPIDILINNAGILANKDPNGRVDYHLWLRLYNTNALGALRVVQTFLPALLASERKVLAFMSSTVASIASAAPSNYGYRMSKVALNMAARCLSMELAEHKVTTLLFYPGHVKTDMGGSKAKITPTESITGIMRQIAESSFADNGRFLDYTGKDIPW